MLAAGTAASVMANGSSGVGGSPGAAGSKASRPAAYSQKSASGHRVYRYRAPPEYEADDPYFHGRAHRCYKEDDEECDDYGPVDYLDDFIREQDWLVYPALAIFLSGYIIWLSNSWRSGHLSLSTGKEVKVLKTVEERKAIVIARDESGSVPISGSASDLHHRKTASVLAAIAAPVWILEHKTEDGAVKRTVYRLKFNPSDLTFEGTGENGESEIFIEGGVYSLETGKFAWGERPRAPWLPQAECAAAMVGSKLQGTFEASNGKNGTFVLLASRGLRF